MVSPAPLIPSPLSATVAVLVTSSSGTWDVYTTVGSSNVFPSESFPSSEVSVMSLVLPGLLPVTTTVLLINPESAAALVIT